MLLILTNGSLFPVLEEHHISDGLDFYFERKLYCLIMVKLSRLAAAEDIIRSRGLVAAIELVRWKRLLERKVFACVWIIVSSAIAVAIFWI